MNRQRTTIVGRAAGFPVVPILHFLCSECHVPQPPVILDEMAQANTGPIQRLASLGLRITGALAFLAPLLTRLVVGWGFHVTGHGKLQDSAKRCGAPSTRPRFPL